jgi:signal transduction histidine kinase
VQNDWVRKAPVVLAVASAAALLLRSGGGGISPAIAVLVCLVAVGWVGATCPSPIAVSALVVVCAAFVVSTARDDSVSAAQGAQPVAVAILVCGLSFAIRRSIDRRMELNRLQIELDLAAARSELARDVHDVTSHALMAVLTQLRVSRRGLGLGNTEGAERALGQAEMAAGQAIQDLRALTLVIAGRSAPLAACGSLAEVRAQISQACANFPHASYDPGSGDDRPLAPAMATTAIRVVQQCLANAAAHSPDTRVTVSTGVEGDCLSISATNPIRSGSGHGLKMGLTIMEQRVHEVGGTLRSGPSGETFTVTCRLPIGVP